jgi:hypothetical protein
MAPKDIDMAFRPRLKATTEDLQSRPDSEGLQQGKHLLIPAHISLAPATCLDGRKHSSKVGKEIARNLSHILLRRLVPGLDNHQQVPGNVKKIHRQNLIV